MEELLSLPDGVNKVILAAGQGNIPLFPDGAKVLFHYRAFIVSDDGEQKILDDSRADNAPFELLLGKKFKLEIWEALIKTMRINEIAEFHCDIKHVSTYPVVSKSLRDMKKKKTHDHDHDHESGHQCGFAALSQGLGYSDLDEYYKDPKPLKFQIELLKVDLPGQYEQDVWSLTAEQQLEQIPIWKEDGNMLFRNGEFDSASNKYSQALGCLEKLVLREKPGSEDWIRLDNMKIPLLLNYSQCMIAKKEYYKAIEHLTTVIEKDKNNVKALFRRAQAYHAVFNLHESRRDYEAVLRLDSSLINTIEIELKKIALDEKNKDKEDREKFKKAFSS